MSAVANHVIRRTSLEVTGSARADAFRFQQEVVAWARDDLMRGLEELFDSLPESEEVIRIDRLEIELNASDIGNWRDEVLRKLRSELFALLVNSSRKRLVGPRTIVEKDAAAAAGNRSAEDEPARPRGDSFLEKLAYYLETGVLPWSLALTSRSQFEAEMERWVSVVASSSSSTEIRRLRPQVEALLRSASSRARFLASFSQPILRKTLSVFFEIPDRVWEELALDARALGLALPEALRDPGPLLLREFVEVLAAHAFVGDIEQAQVEAARMFLSRLVREKQVSVEDLRHIEFRSKGFVRARDVVPAERAAVSAVVESTDSERAPQPALEGIFIQNAGVILLAPFLPTLLERVGLAGEGRLKDPAMAMALMHYLACGEERPAEFQIVLPKVLCGWELEKQIDLPDKIPDVLKDEAEELLRSAVAHWSVLKDTSPDGLREAFLRRAGKISLTKNDQWLLQVEQKPFDMLIQQLPWSFQLVKLPWMKRLLRTEWVD
jgi:hypothetical protein